jgi:hypothetical protein
MMAAMVVPFACRSIASTAPCFEGALRLGGVKTDCLDGFGLADLDFAAGLVARLALGRFAKPFFEMILVVATWLSLYVNDSIMCCH